MPKIILKKTTPAEIIKEVQNVTNKKKEFDLSVFCKLYRHQADTLPWKKICLLFSTLKRKRISVNFLTFTLPEKEHLKGSAHSDNKIQASNNPGLATVVKFLMEDKQVTPLEERVLFWIYKNSDEEIIRNNAKEKIINGNKKILFYFVKTQKFKLDHDQGDMLTEGYMEMRRMFSKFEPEKNFRFMSYIQYSIIQTMRKCSCQEQNLVHLPLNVLNQIYKLNKFIEENGGDGSKELIKEFQNTNKLSEKTMQMLIKYRKGYGKVASLDSMIEGKNSKETSFEQLLPASETTGIKLSGQTQVLLDTLHEILSPEEVQIVVKLYGIGCDHETKKQIIDGNKNLNQAKLNAMIKTIFNKLKKNKNKLKWLL